MIRTALHEHNDCCCYATRFYKGMKVRVSERRSFLARLVKSASYQQKIKLAARYSGLRPSWHRENNLYKRVCKAKLGSYVRTFPKVESYEFDQTLLKAEAAMRSTASFKGNERKLIDAAIRVLKSCKFPKDKFVPTTIRYAAENQINRRSSSGYPHFRRKGLVLNELIKDARSIFRGAKHYWNWPMTRGFRLQVRRSGNELKRKIRVMYPYPGSIILVEDCFIIPFVKHFIENQTFYVIGKTGSGLGELIRKKFSNAKKLTSSDVSSFDLSMVNEVIILAFWILRSQLKLTKQQAAVFEDMVTYYCTSIMVSKSPGIGSYAFVKTHGLPSGSGFTNMIGSLAHAIMLEYACPNLISLEKSLICGDDNLFDSYGINFNSITKTFEECFNMVISVEKTDHFKSWNNVFFLGFKWLNGIRYVDPLLVINQMLWHTDFITDLDPFERELARSASILLNGINGKDLFTKIFPDVMDNIRSGVDIRFHYLYGSAPPTTFTAVTGQLGTQKVSGPPGINSSLAEHLDRGYLIR